MLEVLPAMKPNAVRPSAATTKNPRICMRACIHVCAHLHVYVFVRVRTCANMHMPRGTHTSARMWVRVCLHSRHTAHTITGVEPPPPFATPAISDSPMLFSLPDLMSCVCARACPHTV